MPKSKEGTSSGKIIKEVKLDSKFEIKNESWFDKNVRRPFEDSNIRLQRLNETIEKMYGDEVPEYLDIWAKKDMLPRVQSARLLKIEAQKTDFMKRMIKDDVRINDLDEFLRAMHAPERNARMNALAKEEGRDGFKAASGMSDADAAAVVAKVKKDGNFEKYTKFADELKKVSDDTLDFQVEAGLIKKEDAEEIRQIYENYVPLQRDIEEAGLGTGVGVDIRGIEIKKAKGSDDLRVISPSSQIFQAAQKAQVRALKNEVGQTMIELVEKYPDMKGAFKVEAKKFVPKYDSSGEITGLDSQMQLADNVLGVKKDGKQYFVTIEDPLVARAMKNAGMAELNTFMHGLRQVTGIWSSLATRFNPEFMVTNFQRDLTEALINAKAENIKTKGLSRSIVKNVPGSQKDVWKEVRHGTGSAEMKEFFDLGGDTGNFWLKDAQSAETDMIKFEKQMRGEGIEKIKNPLRKTIGFIDDVNSVVELGTRFSAYKEFVRRGMSKQKAVQAAADLTVNFSRKGEQTGLLSALYAFFNPAVQGASKVIRTLGKSKKARRAAGSLYALGFATRATQGQLAERDGMPDWVRTKQIAFEFPEEFPGVGGKQISLWQMPYGYAPFFALGANTYDMLSKNITGEDAFRSMVNSVAESFLPVEVSTAGLAPTAVTPLVEIGLNENFMGSQVHPEWNTLGVVPSPNYQEYGKRTSEMAKTTSEFLFNMTGGRADVYPDDLDHLLESYTAGTGKFIANTADTAAKLVKGEELDPGEVPMARKFVRDVRTSNIIYRDVFDVLDIAAKRPVHEVKRKRFFEALDAGVEQEVFEQSKADNYRREFFKGQYKIPSISGYKKNEIPEEVAEAAREGIDAMSPEERTQFLGSYSDSTRKKYESVMAEDPQTAVQKAFRGMDPDEQKKRIQQLLDRGEDYETIRSILWEN